MEVKLTYLESLATFLGAGVIRLLSTWQARVGRTDIQ